MTKLIIEIEDGLPAHIAIECVKDVIKEGKISGGFGKSRAQYCYLTRFSFADRHIVVACPKRYKQNSEKFIVYKEHPNEN